MTSIDLTVLGRILSLQSALHAAVSKKQLGELICSAVIAVPGVTFVALCDEEKCIVQAGVKEGLSQQLKNCNCSIDCQDSLKISLQTANSTFGFFCIEVSDENIFAPYRPHIENTINIAALILENKQQAEELSCINKNLEAQVTSRMEALKISEQRLSLALKAAKCGLWDWDIEHDTVFFSEDYFKMAGYETDAFPQNFQEWKKRVHPDDIALTEGDIEKYLAGEIDEFSVEFRFKTAHGDWLWVLSQAEITERGEDGSPLRFSGLHIDIGERKKVEAKLKSVTNRETEMADIVRKAPIAIAYGYPDGTLSNCNSAFSNLTQYSVAELQNINWNEVLTPAKWKIAEEESLAKLCPDNRSVTYEKEYICKDGIVVPIELTVTAKFDQGGNVINYIGFITDITERKQAEQKSNDYQQKLITILNSIDANVYVVDMDSYEILFMNNNMIQDFGADLTGKCCWRVFRNEENPCDHCTNPLLIDDDGQATGVHVWSSHNPITDKYYINHDRAIEWVDNKLVRLQISTDISDVRMMEAQLSQKHKMEAVGYMAGGMAHNFNNNLSIILGNIELSQFRSKDSNVLELLENAKTAVYRSRDLIKQIITYSRKGEQNKSPMQLLDIIDETIGLLLSTLPATINLKKTISPDCDAGVINADASQIQEILVNLCNNAVQAMDEKGELLISLGPVSLSQADIPAQYNGAPGKYAKLSVKDDGCGMTEAVAGKVFDPFFTTKEEHEGAGMGLATVQGIVVQHNGVIKVDSAPGQGAEFSVYFPIIDDVAIEDAPINTDMPKGAEKILFVDDDPMLANLGEQLLTANGYQVKAMTDSQEAFKLFSANSNRFDLLITDQTMPGLSGQELIDKVKLVSPDLPTIICTGFSSKMDENIAKAAGISAFCMKPLDLPELLRTIRQVLDGVAK